MTDGGGKVHPVGQVFQDLRAAGVLFHQGLFDVLKDNGFQPEVIGNKIQIPRDESVLVTVAEKAERDEVTFAAYDLWREGDSTRAGKIPTSEPGSRSRKRGTSLISACGWVISSATGVWIRRG